MSENTTAPAHQLPAPRGGRAAGTPSRCPGRCPGPRHEVVRVAEDAAVDRLARLLDDAATRRGTDPAGLLAALPDALLAALYLGWARIP